MPALSPAAHAAALSLFAVSLVALQNSLIRVVTDSGIHAFEVVFFRTLFGLLSVAAVILWRERSLPRSRWVVRVGATSFIHLISMGAGFLGVALLPLNESAALSFAMPLFATVGAALFLGEDVRIRRWSAVIIGFLGVLIIVRPGYVPISLGAAATLFAAMLGAAITLLFKTFAGVERGTTLIFYQCLFSTLFGIPAQFFVWATPDAFQFAILAVNGILGTISWLCFLRACTLVDASALMPYEFTRLPFVAVFAYLMFGEIPDKWVWLGAAIIFSSTLYIAHREAVAGRRARGVR